MRTGYTIGKQSEGAKEKGKEDGERSGEDVCIAVV
jgi:hypothetical protein